MGNTGSGKEDGSPRWRGNGEVRSSGYGSDPFILFGLGPGERSWRGVLWLALIYLGALAVAAVVAPWVYWGIMAWHEAAPNVLTQRIAHKAFPAYFDRLRWLPTLIALPFVLRVCGLLSWRALGVRLDREGRRIWTRCFLAGAGLLLCVAVAQAAYYGAGWRVEMTPAAGARIFLAALAGGALIGLLEEVVFRGMVFRMLYTATGTWAAMIGASLFFAYAHFKMPGWIWEESGQAVTAGSGWWVAWWTLVGITREFSALAFLNLFLFGMVLSLLTVRTQSLMPAMGLHAGIVVCILCYTKVTTIYQRTAEVGVDRCWGSGGLRDGGLTTLAFLLLIVVLMMSGGIRGKVTREDRTMGPALE